VDIGIDEKNLEEMRRRIIHDMERNLYKLQVRSHKKRLNVKEKGEEDRKKRRGKEGYLYRDISTYSLKDCDENSKKNVLSARYNSEYYDKDDLRDEKKWLFKRQHKRLFNRMDMPVIY
jgi:phage-related minor tail protein